MVKGHSITVVLLLNIPISVRTIGDNTFEGCINLKNLYLSENMLTTLKVKEGNNKKVLGLTDVTIKTNTITLDGTETEPKQKLTKDITK